MRTLPFRLTPPVLAAIAGLLAFFVFLPVVRNGFVVIDDEMLITKNSYVQHLSRASVRHIFTSYDPELYIPLTLLSYQIEYAVVGNTPGVFHFTHVVLHALNTLLVFGVAYRLSGRRRIAAVVCSLLFALHPLQVEAVVWAAARKDVLSGFFFLLSLLLYLRETDNGKDLPGKGSIVAFIFGLLSKASVITLPFIFLTLQWKERALTARTTRSHLPSFLLAALFLVIALIGKRRNLSSLSPIDQLLLTAKSIAFSFWKFLWPVHLTPYYQQETPITLFAPEFLLPILFVLALLATIVLCARRYREISFGLLFFLFAFAPAAATFSKANMVSYFSERYVYLPSIGIFFLVGLFADRLFERTGTALRRVEAALFSLLVLTFIVLCSLQIPVWRTSLSLFEHTARAINAPLAYANMGVIYNENGRKEEAIAAVQKAIQLDPKGAKALAFLAILREEEGNDAEAQALFERSVKATDFLPMYSYEALAPYYYYGEFLRKQGHIAESIAQFEHAVQRGSTFGEPLYNLGLQYQLNGDLPRAEETFAKTIVIAPYHLAALYHLAAVQGEEGKLPEAIVTLEHIVSLDPQYEKAAEHLANLRKMVQ